MIGGVSESGGLGGVEDGSDSGDLLGWDPQDIAAGIELYADELTGGADVDVDVVKVVEAVPKA